MTVAILGVLASVIVLGVETSSRVGGEAKRIDDAAFVLAKLRDASVRYNLGQTFRDTSFTAKISGGAGLYGGTNPGRLSHLTSKITTSDFNSCGFAYTAGQATGWDRVFYSSPISSSTPIQIAPGFFADDTLARYDSTGTSKHLLSGDANALRAPGTLAIVMRNVAISDAQALAARMEGDQSGGNSSIVRFTPNGTAPVTVYYHMEIHGC